MNLHKSSSCLFKRYAIGPLCALLLFGCGDGGSSGSATGTTPTPPSTTESNVTPEVPTTSGIDPTHIPTGDGKLTTTTPQVGYLYVCSMPSSPNPDGKAPWISADGSTWDATAKATVQGSVSWTSTFSTVLNATSLDVAGNGLPAHDTGIFPISTSDPAYQYDANPNGIAAAVIAWGLPANPVIAAQPTCTHGGAIGVLLSGARLYNASDADGRDAVAHEVQDSCGGHPQSMGQYHYHNITSCLSQSDIPGQHSPLVGYVADGFGIYGNLGEDGKVLTNADLDMCHGHTHVISVNGTAIEQYHYHATREFPYSVGCFRGTPVAIH